MSIRRTLSRLVAVAFAVSAVALVAPVVLGVSLVLTPATPAFAGSACCNPVVSGLPSGVETGTPVEITVSIHNRSRTSYPELRGLLVVRLGELDPTQLTVERLGSDGQATTLSVDGSTGTARVVDPGPASLRGGGTHVVRYRLTFAAEAPTGKASLTAEAFGRRSGDWQLIGRSRTASTTVRKGTASPSPSPSASDSGSPVPVATAADQPTPGNTGIRTDSGGLPLLPFAIAGVLLILGGGLGGWWLIKRNNTVAEQDGALTLGPDARYAAPHEATQVVRYGSPGVPPGPTVYTSGQHPSAPVDATRAFPSVPDRPIDATQRIDLPRVEPPPVDPFDHPRPFDPPR
ncbi:MAG TPA: hypothetical protein VF054_10415 [Micromonosporaceae bacterium]